MNVRNNVKGDSITPILVSPSLLSDQPRQLNENMLSPSNRLSTKVFCSIISPTCFSLFSYQDGVTANIRDALGKLMPEGIEDIQVETTFRFAEAITQTIEEPSRTTLGNIHFMIADEISKRFKD